MFGSMKKAMVAAAAVAAVGAVAPAVASADVWRANGAVVGGTPGEPVNATGSLSFTVNVGVLVTTTCNVQATVDLFNTAGNAAGDVTSFGVASPLTNCTVVGVPNCRVSLVTSTGFPWAVSTVGTSATISGVSFTNTYVDNGGTCALAGSRTITGSVTGTVTNAPSRLTFTNATGLTANPGALPTTVNGSVNLVGEAPLNKTITLLP